ncbi:MAG TPA: DUF1552 domain-containing protein [Pirellulaceae bacterium]|jgi:hypothetical protein
MKSNCRARGPRVTRRTLLRAAGISLALPLLESLAPRVHGAESKSPRRMVFICGCLGLHAPDFFPKQAGQDYELSPYLQELSDFRRDFTVFSGLSHPDVGGGHPSEASFLTAAPHANSPSFRNTISIDQLIAEQHGAATRHPFLALATDNGSLSWTRNGVQIPAHKDPAQLFRKLFITGTPEEVQMQSRLLAEGRSVLDSVKAETQSLERQVSSQDRQRLDQYFSAVRAVEVRLQNAAAWESKPKPQVSAEPPGPLPPVNDVIGRANMMYDLIHLALQTDSTRLVTLSLDQVGAVPPIPGVTDAYHQLSHHGQEPTKIAQLRLIELAHMRAFASLLKKLKTTDEASTSLLDNTMVLFGSNMGNASSHDTHNLPILLAGGGFRHGQHIAHRGESNQPLANLYVTMLQRFGMETDHFGSSTGTTAGLEAA